MSVLRGFIWTVGAVVVLVALAFWLRPLDFFDDFTYMEEAFHGVRNQWTWVDGQRMHYEVEGPASGPPVVLVHGLGGRAEDWRALAPYFAKAGFHVYMPDLIGYGRSAQPRNFSYCVGNEADVVVGFLDAVGLKQVDLGGWSMGGWIVQLVAADHPDRVKRLMLFDSAGLHEMPGWDTSLFTPVNATQLNELDALLTPHPPRIPGFVASDILRVSKQSGWVVSRAMAAMLSGRDVTDNLLPQLRMPVLIEWGAQDRIIPLDQAEKIHRLVPQSHLDVYPGCGHLAPLQCTDQMGPNVLRFVEQGPAAVPSSPPAPAQPHSKLKVRTETAALTSAREPGVGISAQN